MKEFIIFVAVSLCILSSCISFNKKDKESKVNVNVEVEKEVIEEEIEKIKTTAEIVSKALVLPAPNK